LFFQTKKDILAAGFIRSRRHPPEAVRFRNDNREDSAAMATPNMQGMMKQVQKLQEKMAQVQSELEQKSVTADAGGGMISVKVNGKQQLLSIKIEKEVVNPEDVEMLEDLIVSAVNKGMEESQRMAQEEMEKVTAGVLPRIPGLSFPGL
jgi:DNA-binding YbaB/EbfC family protein